MKFEDLKKPWPLEFYGKLTLTQTHLHAIQAHVDAVVRNVYDQMREHYEADKKQPAPEWRLPDPPPGQHWHRDDWTQDMLVDSEGNQYRPLLLGEEEQRGDEFTHHGIWKPTPSVGCIMRTNEPHTRTRRPLPAPAEYVPLEPDDVPPGSAVRLISDTDKWQLIIAADPDCVHTNLDFHRWRFLSEHYEILRPGSTTWEPCKKPKP